VTRPLAVVLRGFYVVASALTLGNAGWMLIAPESWFVGLPAAIPDTGPFNGHLVRDLGVAFAVIGLALAWCARHPGRARGVHLAVTAFLAGHALIHVADLASGRLPHRHWLLDLPLTFMPALIFLAIAVPPVWRRLAGEGRAGVMTNSCGPPPPP
jgi:phosphatidylserine synthase